MELQQRGNGVAQLSWWKAAAPAGVASS